MTALGRALVEEQDPNIWPRRLKESWNGAHFSDLFGDSAVNHILAQPMSRSEPVSVPCLN